MAVLGQQPENHGAVLDFAGQVADIHGMETASNTTYTIDIDSYRRLEDGTVVPLIGKLLNEDGTVRVFAAQADVRDWAEADPRKQEDGAMVWSITVDIDGVPHRCTFTAQER